MIRKLAFVLILLTVVCMMATGCKPRKPVAAFNADIREGTAPLKVFFTDESTIEKSLLDADGMKELLGPVTIPKKQVIESWEWNFGDGETSDAQHTYHTFAAPGQYDVSLTVKTSREKTDSATRKNYITVFSNEGEMEGESPEGEPTEGENEGEPTEGEGEEEGESGACDPDLTPPVITLLGEHAISINCGTVYNDAGATAVDACDGAITTAIIVENPVNTLASGTYVVRYNVSDQSGNAASEVTRSVTVADNCQSFGEELTITLPGEVPLVLVQIPAGAFMMGRYPGEQESGGDEDPQHAVTFAQEFWMGKYEVTQQQWLAVMDSWPTNMFNEDNGVGNDYPAYSVSWNDVQDFIIALNAHIVDTGQGPATVRLPSEAEWEYAARAATGTRFYWGDDPSYTALDAHAWYTNNSGDSAHPVGEKLENPFGLYDMVGNVWEWCEDDYHEDYTDAPVDGSPWTDSPRAEYRVVRGGSKSEQNWGCRLANRLKSLVSRYANTGFRIVADVPVQ
jgi:formylglycine-generating enzyme required for sulfatase activity